jgi:glycosyltransferase involved in cell wall biosynthesis
MNNKQPLVSVLTACYNQSTFVRESLESIRQQTYKNIRLIIIDDCSTDDSVSVIQDWITKNSVECVFVAHSENKGVCKTLNEALSYARGKYISMIAADDVWLLDKIENQVRTMEKLPQDVGVIYSDAWQIDENSDLLPKKFIESHRQLPPMPEGHIFPVLLEKNFIPAMTTLIRRSCYDVVGTYDENLCYEDYDMWLRISRHYKFVFSPVISAKYRIVSTSMTLTVLQNPNCDSLRSNFRIFSKCLIPNKNGNAQQRVITDHLNEIAEEMYKLNCKKRNAYLWKLFRCDLRPHSLGMLIFSLLGISYNRFSSFISWQAGTAPVDGG